MFMNWIKSNKVRAISIAVLIVVIVIVAIVARQMSVKQSDPMSGVHEDYQPVAEDSDISGLLSSYYEAYAANDIATLEQIAYPISDIEKSYIAFMSQYVNGYNVNEVFSKQGRESGEYLVSASVDVDFTDVEQPAPGLDFFYMRTDDNGNLYIDNTYSFFNLSYQVIELDPEIQALIQEFEAQEDVRNLRDQVQASYDTLMESDEGFAAFMNETLPVSLQGWLVTYEQELAAAEAAAAAEAEAAAAAEAAAIAEAEAAAEEANAVIVITTDRINVRDSASDEGGVLGKVDAGTQLKKYADEGEWSKIEYNGSRAYVKTEYVQLVDSASEETSEENTSTVAAGGYHAGDVVTLSDIVNLRHDMDENSIIDGKVETGDSVKVVENSYDNGWTKVEHRGRQGYIRTDVLR